MRKLLANTALTALLAAVLAPAAWAGPVLYAAVSDLHLQAIDLNPTDTVGASYELISQAGSYVNAVTATPDTIQNSGPLVPGADFANVITQGQFTSTLNGTAGFGDVSARLEVADTQVHSGYMSSTYTYTAQLTLSAGSALILSGELLQQFAPAGMDPRTPAGSAFTASLTRRNGNDSYTSIFEPTLGQGWLGDRTGGWDEQSDFAVTLTNPGSTTATVDLTFVLKSSLSHFAPVSNVPEPSTYLMLGAGLLLVGTIARRRTWQPRA